MKFKRQFAGRTFGPRRVAAIDLLVFTFGGVDLGNLLSTICAQFYAQDRFTLNLSNTNQNIIIDGPKFEARSNNSTVMIVQ